MAENEENPVDQLSKALMDVVHVTVGLSLLTFQRVQVLRRECEAAWQRRFPAPKQ